MFALVDGIDPPENMLRWDSVPDHTFSCRYSSCVSPITSLPDSSQATRAMPEQSSDYCAPLSVLEPKADLNPHPRRLPMPASPI